jgi:hypothetical protein
MNSRRYTFRPSAQIIVGAMALLTFAGAGIADEKAPIAVVEVKPPGTCKHLGKVTGTSQGNPVNESRAKEDALTQAKDLGATHFWYMPQYSGQRGSYTWVYFGVAFRCPAAPAAAPAAPAPAPSPAN